MRLSDKLLIVGVAAGLSLAVTLVVASSGTRETEGHPAHEVEPQTQATVEPTEVSVPDTAADTRTREASAALDDELEFVDAARRREGRKREAEFLSQFLALRTEQGAEAFERAVRDVLASSSEPIGRKNAGLRALHSANVPGTDALLAGAVQTQADVSDGSSLSVPRSALKLLFERAPSGEDARRALARLCYVEDARVSDDLRRRASSALKASIHGAQRDEVVRLLRLEASAAELDAALAALARDANFGAAKAP